MDNKLGHEFMQAACWDFYCSGERHGVTVDGAMKIFNARRNHVRRAFRELVKAGWMETYIAHGEIHYRITEGWRVELLDENEG